MQTMKDDYYASKVEAPRVLDLTKRLHQHHKSLSDELRAVHELVVCLAAKAGLDTHVEEYEADGQLIRPDELPEEPYSVHDAVIGIRRLVSAMTLGRPNERVRDIRALLDQLNSPVVGGTGELE